MYLVRKFTKAFVARKYRVHRATIGRWLNVLRVTERLILKPNPPDHILLSLMVPGSTSML